MNYLVHLRRHGTSGIGTLHRMSTRMMHRRYATDHSRTVKESMRRRNKSQSAMYKDGVTLMKDDHDHDPHVIVKHSLERELDNVVTRAVMSSEEHESVEVMKSERGTREVNVGDGEWKLYKRSYAIRRIVNYLKRRESTSRTALFVVGPHGSGKSTVIAHVRDEIAQEERHYLPLELDFETYFVKDQPQEQQQQHEESDNVRRRKMSFDNFVSDYFSPMIARELCKIPQRLFDISEQHDDDETLAREMVDKKCEQLFGVDAVYDILTERMSIRYSMRNCLARHPKLSAIEEITQELQKDSRDKDSERELFRLICKYYHREPQCKSFPRFDHNESLQQACNAIYFAMELVEKKELDRAINQGPSGTEILYFFVTVLEYLAFRDPFQDILQPKLFITGLHMLDIFSHGVELRHRNDIYGQHIDEKQDYRGPDLHDHFLLRVAEMYLDPFIPTVVEVEGNFYNFHMIPELKLDADQVEYVELLDYTLAESRMLFGRLFREDEFLPIYDKIGGNVSKIKGFFETYRRIDKENVPEQYQEETFKEMKHSMRLYLSQERYEFDRRLLNAYQLLARYIAQENNESQDRLITHWSVQFRMIQTLERVMDVHGTMNTEFTLFDMFAETCAGAALINSNILYMQQHIGVCRMSYMSYYTFVADHLRDIKESWSLSKKMAFHAWKRTSRDKLPSMKGVDEKEVFDIWTNN